MNSKDFSMVYDVFPEKYCDILQKYIERIDGLFCAMMWLFSWQERLFVFIKLLKRIT